MAFEDLEYSENLGYPVELFLFMNGAMPLGFTSADEPTVFAGVEYKNTEYLECENIEDLAEGSGKNDTTIKVSRTFPIALLYQTTPPPNPIWLTIYRFHRGDNDYKRYWGGKVRNVVFNGEFAEITVDSEGAALERLGLWKTYQPVCNHILFSLPCGLSSEANRTLITVSGVDGNEIEAFDNAIGALGDGHTALGEARRLSNNDRRTITAHIDNTITLLQPFEDLQIGEQLHIFAGCDGTKAMCSSGKFLDADSNPVDNTDNHGGFDKIPAKNPVQVGLK